MKIFLFWLLNSVFISIVVGQVQKSPQHYNHPFEESYQPLVIRVNAILLKRNDGSGNFDMEDPEEKELFMQYLNTLNYMYSNFQNPPDYSGCYRGTDFIKDARIRFEFNVIEVRNTYFWDYLNSGARPEQGKTSGFSPHEKWYIKPLDDSIANLDIPKGIHAYFTQNGLRFDSLLFSKGEGYDVTGKMAGQHPTTTNLRRSSQVHIPNRYLAYIYQRYQSPKNYNTTWEETKYWWLDPGFSHEIGHDLGLGHSNEHYATNKCIYTLMSQRNDHKRNWLPPPEIRKIHWNLTRTNLMQFVTEDSHYGVSWLIEKDTVWDKPRRFYNDLEIAKDVTLTISDSIILPPQSFIKLNKNSKIIITGNGMITDAYGNGYKNFDKHRTAMILRE